MKVYVNLKQVGKKKNSVEREIYDISDNIGDVRGLIKEFVGICVKDFNKHEVIKYLSGEEIFDLSESGKIGFNDRENKTLQNLEDAVERAVQSYKDSIYRIFLNDEEVGGLDDRLEIEPDDVLTFVKLTMLAGRMW